MRLKRLMNIVRNNTLEELIDKYKASVRCGTQLYAWSDQRYSLDYFTDTKSGYIRKSVLFKEENGKNKILVLALSNTHSFREKLKFTPSQITVSKKALAGAKSIQETANTIIK